MKISSAQVTEVTLSEIEGLETTLIRLSVKDLGDHRGELHVDCGGYRWGTTWGAMGTDSTLAFIASCDEDYLLNRLCPTNPKVEDLPALRKMAKQSVLKQRRAGEINKETASSRYHALGRMVDMYDSSSLLHKALGEDWHHNIPMKPSNQYAYYHGIMQAICQAAKQLSESSVG